MASKLSRRDLGAIALAGAWAPDAEYHGPLTGFESHVELDSFDPVHWLRERHKQAPLRLTFQARTRDAAAAWQESLRVKLIELMGGFPAERVALAPETLEVREFPNYRRERFVFHTRPGVSVLGCLLTPLKGSAPFPAVVCVPGHGRGLDEVIGVDEHGREQANPDGYQHGYALQVVAQGLAAVVIEPLAFGCRRDPVTRRKGPDKWACQPVAAAALLFGETMIAWRVWDVMRTIDWIATRKDLDARRVGCVGISGGGTCTLFSAALEPRIRAAFVSGYLNTFRDSILSLEHCVDNYVPGILNWAEMYDVAGLIAPRPLFAEAGTEDDIFPIEAFRESYARVKRVYDTFGAASSLDYEIFEGEHQFRGTRGVPFLAAHL
jgi:dienelactone hydrolase